MLADMARFARACGFTLIEVLVVLALMGLAAGLVAPALLHARRQQPSLGLLIPTAREEAARRGEMVYLRIAGSGQWRMEGAASSAAGPFAAGHLEPFPGVPLTLIVSPIGTCAFDVPSAAAARVIRLDPLTCDITSP
jgi:prepilin-type N-terminal cleavage/methylation domain-containing protein